MVQALETQVANLKKSMKDQKENYELRLGIKKVGTEIEHIITPRVSGVGSAEQ